MVYRNSEQMLHCLSGNIFILCSFWSYSLSLFDLISHMSAQIWNFGVDRYTQVALTSRFSKKYRKLLLWMIEHLAILYINALKISTPNYALKYWKIRTKKCLKDSKNRAAKIWRFCAKTIQNCCCRTSTLDSRYFLRWFLALW